MYFKQFYLGCLSHASYFIGDEKTKTAAIVDPQRDIDCYLEEARSKGMEIRHVLLTHFHADFVSGHLELMETTGADIYVGEAGKATYPSKPARDGELLEFGDVRIKFLSTPGHTLESTSYLVFDLSADENKPYAVLTGDTLFIGDVGRPDLLVAKGVSSGELAGMLYDSLHTKLLTLPDDTLVYPAHGAGSMCGKNLSTETFSTLGNQRRFNYALQPMPKEEFVKLVSCNQPQAPQYFSYDAELNQKERSTLDKNLSKSLKPLPIDEVIDLQTSKNAVILDCRDPDSYAENHISGSTNVGLGGKYATWAGTVISPDSLIVLVAEPGKEKEAVMRLGRIGLDNIAGYLEGGINAAGSKKTCRSVRISVPELVQSLSSDCPPTILDVRGEGEFRESHLDGAINIPLNVLSERISEVPRKCKLAVHCRSGYRSSIAASILERHGITDVVDLVGGIQAWIKAGQATISETAGVAG